MVAEAFGLHSNGLGEQPKIIVQAFGDDIEVTPRLRSLLAHFAAERGHFAFKPAQPSLDPLKPSLDLLEPSVDLLETAVDSREAAVNPPEPRIHRAFEL